MLFCFSVCIGFSYSESNCRNTSWNALEAGKINYYNRSPVELLRSKMLWISLTFDPPSLKQILKGPKHLVCNNEGFAKIKLCKFGFKNHFLTAYVQSSSKNLDRPCGSKSLRRYNTSKLEVENPYFQFQGMMSRPSENWRTWKLLFAQDFECILAEYQNKCVFLALLWKK